MYFNIRVEVQTYLLIHLTQFLHFLNADCYTLFLVHAFLPMRLSHVIQIHVNVSELDMLYCVCHILSISSNGIFRCQASCVALTTTIALLVQKNERQIKKSGSYDVEAVVDESFTYASKILVTYAEVW